MNEYRIDKFLWRAEVEEVWGVDPAVCDRSWPWHGCVDRFWWGRDCGPVWFLLRTRVWSSWSCWPKCGRNLCCRKWIKFKISLNFDLIQLKISMVNFLCFQPLFPAAIESLSSAEPSGTGLGIPGPLSHNRPSLVKTEISPMWVATTAWAPVTGNSPDSGRMTPVSE